MLLHSNLSYEVIEPPDLLWGIEQEDGTWNGMIAQVMNKVSAFYDNICVKCKMCNNKPNEVS
jgi:hypothetical protein